MKNANGWTVTVKMEGGRTKEVYSRKHNRDAAHADVIAFCGGGRVVCSTKN